MHALVPPELVHAPEVLQRLERLLRRLDRVRGGRVGLGRGPGQAVQHGVAAARGLHRLHGLVHRHGGLWQDMPGREQLEGEE